MARDVLDSELAALIGESYTRAYQTVVMVQMVSQPPTWRGFVFVRRVRWWFW